MGWGLGGTLSDPGVCRASAGLVAVNSSVDCLPKRLPAAGTLDHRLPACIYRSDLSTSWSWNAHLAKEGNKRWSVFGRRLEAADTLSRFLSLEPQLPSLWNSACG